MGVVCMLACPVLFGAHGHSGTEFLQLAAYDRHRKLERFLSCNSSSHHEKKGFWINGMTNSEKYGMSHVQEDANALVSVNPNIKGPVQGSSPAHSDRLPLRRVAPESLQAVPGLLLVNRQYKNLPSSSMSNYLIHVLSSKVYDVAIESPLELAPKLSERMGANIFLKREDMQSVCTIF
mgnify:CR=1 FL=1